ncbi:MAG: efflux RND transporter periplasmic adaptor subunit [Candidatus Krumholzibacteriia bacterium]
MSAAQRPKSRRRRLLRGLGGFLILALIVAGVVTVKRGQEVRASNESSATAEADSSLAAGADSAAADTTAAAEEPEKKGGLFGFLRGRNKAEKESEDDEKDAVPVELASVGRQDVPSYFTGTATVEAEQRAQVLAKIAGTVQNILVEEGDPIRAGQVLLQIDDAEEKARLEELRVRAASLEREYERTTALLAKDLASDREFEDKKLLMEEARAKLLVGEIRLGYTKVRAPFGGRVTQRHIHVGEHVQLNQALFDIADFDPLLVRVFMPERQVDRIHVGQQVRVVPDARSGVSYPGRVRMVSPIVDTRSGTVKVTVELDDKVDDLRIGAFVRVQITTDIHEDALVIPKVALVEEGGESYVYRAEADSVVKVRVETGYTSSELAEVLVGLSEGDRVVTVGQGGLKHGSHVRELQPVEAKADTSQASSDSDESDLARR